MRSLLLFIILVVGLSTPIFGQQSPSKILYLSGGATVQRQRIDRAIETAGKLNVEEAIQSLSQYNESYELAGIATMSPSSPGSCFMNSMLADRRISKVLEHLLSLPVAEAETKAQQIFDEHCLEARTLVGKVQIAFSDLLPLLRRSSSAPSVIPF